MFHPGHIITAGPLETVWKAVHDITFETSNEEYNLPKMCRSLDTWVCSEAFQEDRRLSLRTSATLISGLAKLYKSGIGKLFEDVKTLDENITYRKRGRTNSGPDSLRILDSFSSSSYDSSDYAATLELTRRECVHDFDTSFSSSKRVKTSISRNNITIRHSMNRSAESISTTTQRRTRSETKPVSLSNQSNRSSKQTEDSTSPINQKRDEGAQTSPAIYTPERDSKTPEHDCLDKNLPFAYILVHDNYHSRVPSRIIMSSINSDVRNLN